MGIRDVLNKCTTHKTMAVDDIVVYKVIIDSILGGLEEITRVNDVTVYR